MSRNNQTDLSNNQTIREAIRKISLHGLVNRQTGAVRGTGKTTGYVAKIHTDGELAGTIDVQEYVNLAIDEKDEKGVGYHEGVFLSALQDNSKGMVIVPKLYSEVVLSKDSETGAEYVSMFSHVDVIQLDSHDTIIVGVKEREEFDENDEESPDVEELEETGIYTKTEYKKDSIYTEIQAEKDKDDANVIQVIDGGGIKQNIHNNKTITNADGDGFHVTHDKTKLELGDAEATMEMGSSKVKVTDGVVYVGSDSGTDDAVLGGALCDILMDLCSYLAQVKTTTQLGPQPFINMAQFISLKSKIQAAKAGHNNFLTKKVQIQK